MQTALVVTTIAPPHAILQDLAKVAQAKGWTFYVIGDRKSPQDFELSGSEYYNLERQQATGLKFAEKCPQNCYARKNIGYLLAIRAGAETIIETDDDNKPARGFDDDRCRTVEASLVAAPGWVNVYGYFGRAEVWPRGLPLDATRNGLPERGAAAAFDCPIQQGLANENPDVDAVYRLVKPLPVRFEHGPPVALAKHSWCPFNSQNTTWFRDAFPLMYLPATCPFRMTDIWRSLVAQRVAWQRGWSVLFHEATVVQERNSHNLMRDFEDEIPGYLNNRRIAERLDALSLTGDIGRDMTLCYEALVEVGIIHHEELDLLNNWLNDVATVSVEAATA
jgi:hypothetical protein